jgi:hypothetical protein
MSLLSFIFEGKGWTRWMTLAGMWHVWGGGGGSKAYKVVLEQPEEDQLEDLAVARRIILKFILNRMGWPRLDSMAMMESCEHGNEPSGSIKCREFLDKLQNY